MTGPACQIHPQINEEDSILHVELVKALGNQELANLVYACYLQKGVAAALDAQGFNRNKQGQHRAKQVIDFLDVAKMQIDRGNFEAARRALGAVDAAGNLLEITDTYDAAKKVVEFNKNHQGLVSSIMWDGSKYTYYVGERGTSNYNMITRAEDNLIAFEAIKKEIESNPNVDFNALISNSQTKGYLNPTQGVETLKNLTRLKNTNIKYLRRAEVATLLRLHPDDIRVLRLERMFGSLEDAADNIIGIINGSVAATAGQVSLITTTLNSLKTLQKYNFDELLKDVNEKINNAPVEGTSREVDDILMNLSLDFDMNINSFQSPLGNLTNIEQVAVKGLITLNRRLKELTNKKERTIEEEREKDELEGTIKDVEKQINSKKYLEASLNLLHETKRMLGTLQDLEIQLRDIKATQRDTAMNRGKIMHELKDKYQGYYNIIEALANINSLDSFVPILKVDKDALEAAATPIKEEFKKLGKIIDNQEQEVMMDILQSILGDTLPNGQSIANIFKGMNFSTAWYDMLYSFSRGNNPISAAMGTITRDAQLERNKRLQEIEREIREITDDLYKSGSNSEFMYEDDHLHIISDIDWEAFEAAAEQYASSGETEAQKRYLKAFFKKTNSEERVVDMTTGRTELVPNNRFRKPFPKLTPAQQTYYDKMMALKASLESLLPAKAQNLYRPPQVKRSIGDVLLNSKSFGIFKTGVAEHFKDHFRWKEDDVEHVQNGFIEDGEEFKNTAGDFSGRKKKEIPIFYVKPLNNPNELLTDFSAALHSEASTAINFDCMGAVVDVVEFMKDFMTEKIPSLADDRGVAAGEAFTSKVGETVVALTEKLIDDGKKAGCEKLVQGFLDSQFYGIKIADNSKWAPIILKSITYSSIKTLAVNLKGAISNAKVGNYQVLIEAAGGEFFSFKDYFWASGRLFGDIISKTPGKIMDLLLNNKSSKDVLISDLFGFMPNYYRETKETRFYKNPLRHLFGHDLSMAGYGVGEWIIHSLVGLAILHHQKVLINGEKTSLYNAYEKVGNKRNPTLALKSGVTDLEGNPVDDNYMEQVRGTILYTNQSCHGAMSDEDKSYISMFLLGRLVLNFRQWMIETYARRYRKEHWDGTLHNVRSGYLYDTQKFLKGLFKDAQSCDMETAIKWKDMNTRQRANVRRATMGIALFFKCLAFSFLLGDPDDDDNKGNWGKRMLIYQNMRALFDLGYTELPIVGAALTLDSIYGGLIPAAKSIKGLLYPIIGIVDRDYDKTVKKRILGKKMNVNKYMYNTFQYAVPFWKDINQISNMSEEDDIYMSYDSSTFYR